jgi:hypothetical protein
MERMVGCWERMRKPVSQRGHVRHGRCRSRIPSYESYIATTCDMDGAQPRRLCPARKFLGNCLSLLTCE